MSGWIMWVLVACAFGLTLAVVRRTARSRRRRMTRIPTGPAALVGKHAIVLERIVNHEGVGCIKIDGEVWTARAYDRDQILESGTRVEVVQIKGATALVAE